MRCVQPLLRALPPTRSTRINYSNTSDFAAQKYCDADLRALSLLCVAQDSLWCAWCATLECEVVAQRQWGWAGLSTSQFRAEPISGLSRLL